MHSQWADYINQNVSGANATVREAEVGDNSITVDSAHILDVCTTLRDSSEHKFNVLQVITGTDYPEHLEISYVLASFINNTELILKTKLPKAGEALPSLNSVCDVWKAANWQERECADMIGVEFVGHPDPRRILCPDDWEGYPMRKDYKAAEKYKHMTVYPVNKMNIADQEFAEKQKAAEKAAKEAAKAAAADSEGKES